jgi:hypothetical protein
VSGLTLQDVLRAEGIAPEDVSVMLHSPSDREFSMLLPGLARTRRGIVEAYSAMHSANAEAALRKGRPWVTVFLRTELRRGNVTAMLFLGLYENRGSRLRTHAEIRAEPDVAWICENRNEYIEFREGRGDLSHRWFDLSQSARLADLQGRLVIGVRLTPNYVRRGEKLEGPVWAIQGENTFDAPPPDWRRLTLSAGVVDVLPPGWAARLREWRGIYLIVDEVDGARYVGSACGKDGLLGRWRAHVAGDHGVTVGLADRDPRRFRFSILERTSPDAPADEVTRLEQTWMERLHTIRWGLNRPTAVPKEGLDA